ncbi:MAG: hypothetical protein JRE43_00945, partial [Deltaproteobacteria bacterium]|nr:hypothetical protein [Deltaproteobacteria bacterium]
MSERKLAGLVVQALVVVLLTAPAPARAIGTETYNGCAETQDDPCVR